jgi:hypothetical protein
MNKEELEKWAGRKADMLKVFMQYRNGFNRRGKLNEENDNGEV